MRLENISQSLQINQQAIQTTSHNITNANTPGFSRQEVILNAGIAQQAQTGNLGTGLDASGIERKKDLFIEQRISTNLQNQGKLNIQSPIFAQLENMFNLSDEDLLSKIDKFTQNLGDLSLRPEDDGQRQIFVDTSKELAASFQQHGQSLSEIEELVADKLKDQVPLFNNLTTEIANLNDAIVKSADSPNDLLDQREQKIRELSSLGNISVSFSEAGHAKIFLGTQPVVEENVKHNLIAIDNGNTTALQIQGTNNNVSIDSGQIGGLLELQNNILPQQRNQLNDLMNNFALEINKIHSTGIGKTSLTNTSAHNAVADPLAPINTNGFSIQNGDLTVQVRDQATGNTVDTTINIDPNTESLEDIRLKLDAVGDISASIDTNGHLSIQANSGFDFVFPQDTSDFLAQLQINPLFTGNTIDDIEVAPELADLSKLALAKSFGPLNNENVLNMQQIMQNSNAALGDLSFNDFLSNTISQVGQEAQALQNQESVQNAVINNLENLRESISGVSIDEELVNLNKFQRSFEASTRVFQTLNGLLEDIVNLGL